MRTYRWGRVGSIFEFLNEDGPIVIEGKGAEMPTEPPSPALRRIRDLVKEHHLGYNFDPGGVEFRHADPAFGVCRIGGEDDTEDLRKLEDWLDLDPVRRNI